MTDMPVDPHIPSPPSSNGEINVTLGYIQRDISKIQTDIGVMKNDVISRREFTDGMSAVRKEFTDAITALKEAITGLQKREEVPTFWVRNQDKIAWGIIFIILMLFYYLLTHAGFPNFLSK